MGLIRCDHCGWGNNPEDAKRCQKCNQELVLSVPEPTPDMFETVKRTESVMPDCAKCGYPLSPEISFCPNCGAPTGVASASTPASHAPAARPSVDPAMKATIRDVSADMLRGIRPEPASVPVQPEIPAAQPPKPVQPAMNQTVRIGATPFPEEKSDPLPEEKTVSMPVPASTVAYPAITKKILPETAVFKLRPIDMEAPEAFSFGTDTNASFEFEEGQWYITDESGSNSAYVSAARRIALEKGDVVLIGGRRYRFE